MAEPRDLDEDTALDLDAQGNICAIAFEHAGKRTEMQQVTLAWVAA